MPLDDDDLDLRGLIHLAEGMAERYAWSPEGRRLISSRLCGSETGHIRAIAGRPVENVYSPSYT